MNTKQKVYKEIEEMFGTVPTFLKSIPDDTIELEWQLMKKTQFDPGLIPNKYRELIGIGVAAATRCKYCTLFHTEAAKLSGATEDEIKEAMRFAKSTMGWSTYLNGMQYEYEDFKAETLAMTAHVRDMMSKGRQSKRMAAMSET
ncbi:MAG: carboxymuconolactone decarboxylase family protein [Candidatus Woesearchaeota archaeon]